MQNHRTAQKVYWCFWALSPFLFLVGLIGHWPSWSENILEWIGFPWSLITIPLSIRIETALHFGITSLVSSIVLILAIPATLDYFLIFLPLLKLYDRAKSKGSNAISS